MTYVSNAPAASGRVVDTIWRSVGEAATRVFRAMMAAQERRARLYLEQYRRDRFCW